MGFVKPMNVLSHDQDCSEAGQSRPIYDTFPTAASVSKTDCLSCASRDVGWQKGSNFASLVRSYELSYIAGPIFFDEFLW
jgi:hypothetical protein